MSKIVIFIYNIAFWLHQKKVPLLPELINKVFIRLLFSCQIGMGAVLGEGIDLGYGGLGVVIHPRCILGRNVQVGSGVTLGGRSGKFEVPVVGDNCVLGSGAKIIGPIKIGNNCRIGANAVVLQDVPDNHLAVGVPAKIRPL